jgi:hypothetical protein
MPSHPLNGITAKDIAAKFLNEILEKGSVEAGITFVAGLVQEGKVRNDHIRRTVKYLEGQGSRHAESLRRLIVGREPGRAATGIKPGDTRYYAIQRESKTGFYFVRLPTGQYDRAFRARCTYGAGQVIVTFEARPLKDAENGVPAESIALAQKLPFGPDVAEDVPVEAAHVIEAAAGDEVQP